MRGFFAQTRSCAKPSFSIFCGRIECTKTSAPSISRHNASAAAGFLRSSTSERLLRLSPMNSAAMLGERAGPVWRGASPSGASILMTSAPMSPSICVARGPATTEVRSRMRMPARGPAMFGPYHTLPIPSPAGGGWPRSGRVGPCAGTLHFPTCRAARDGLPLQGRLLRKRRDHFLGEQPHRLLRFGEIERAEIDLQRGVLEFAHGVFETADDGLDLVGRADPGATRLDLALQRRILHAADRNVVAFVVLGRRALGPFAGGLIERDKIILELAARDLARELCVRVAEHMERDHHFAVAGMAGVAPGLAVDRDQILQRADRNRHQRVAGAAGELERIRRARRGDVKFRPRLLRRSRQRGDVFEVMKLAAVRDVFLRQQQFDLLETFAEAGDGRVWRYVEAPEFVRQEGAREADVEAAARN